MQVRVFRGSHAVGLGEVRRWVAPRTWPTPAALQGRRRVGSGASWLAGGFQPRSRRCGGGAGDAWRAGQAGPGTCRRQRARTLVRPQARIPAQPTRASRPTGQSSMPVGQGSPMGPGRATGSPHGAAPWAEQQPHGARPPCATRHRGSRGSFYLLASSLPTLGTIANQALPTLGTEANNPSSSSHASTFPPAPKPTLSQAALDQRTEANSSSSWITGPRSLPPGMSLAAIGEGARGRVRGGGSGAGPAAAARPAREGCRSSDCAPAHLPSPGGLTRDHAPGARRARRKACAVSTAQPHSACKRSPGGLTGVHPQHPGHGRGRRGVDAQQARVRAGGQDQGGVRRAGRQPDVVHVLGGAGHLYRMGGATSGCGGGRGRG